MPTARFLENPSMPVPSLLRPHARLQRTHRLISFPAMTPHTHTHTQSLHSAMKEHLDVTFHAEHASDEQVLLEMGMAASLAGPNMNTPIAGGRVRNRTRARAVVITDMSPDRGTMHRTSAPCMHRC